METARWRLVMAFCEDDSKINHDHAHENLSTLREIARDFTLPQSKLQEAGVFKVEGGLQPRIAQSDHAPGSSEAGPLKSWKASEALEGVARERLP